MAYRNPPLTRSHNPFARSARLGPGPKGRTLDERGDWTCRKSRRRKYEQVCLYVGKDENRQGTVKVVVERPKAKAKRNRQYNSFLRASGEPRFPNRLRPSKKRASQRRK